MIARLLLEDGTLLEGKAFGANKQIIGEVVFNTGMTGYQEILTDPSYGGQVVVMTYPLIGNYGINNEDVESDKIQVTALVVKELCDTPSHWQNKKTLDEYLKENDIPGIYGIDTRMLTKKIRSKGTMKCLLTTEEINDEHKKKLLEYNFPTDIVAQVTRKNTITIEGGGLKLGVIDLGIKNGIINNFSKMNCDIKVYPWDITVEELLKEKFDAILLSNGPGDPKDCQIVIDNVKKLMGKVPLRGICLGNQILSLALGADTYKLKFGHRGSNHPVQNIKTNKVYISSQNHGYAVKEDSLTEDMEVTFINVNDHTIEGFKSKKYNIEAVQFHPEEGPGPEDTHEIFEQWVKSLEEGDINA